MSRKTTLMLIRGLPGAGKTALANLMRDHYDVFYLFAADDLFMTTEGYVYDRSRQREAHDVCFENTQRDLKEGRSVAVHNTFSRRWEMERYLSLAREIDNLACGFDVCLIVVDLFDAGLSDEELAARCVHGVSVDIIATMRARWEHDWRPEEQRIKTAAWVALDQIAALCGCPEWDYPGQVVRDVQGVLDGRFETDVTQPDRNP